MRKPLFAIIFIGLGNLAQANEPPYLNERHQAGQQFLEKVRNIESHSHQGRIRILQHAEGCIQAAKTHQEYRQCEQQEKLAREQLREELRPRHQALRDEVRQLRGARQSERQSTEP